MTEPAAIGATETSQQHSADELCMPRNASRSILNDQVTRLQAEVNELRLQNGVTEERMRRELTDAMRRAHDAKIELAHSTSEMMAAAERAGDEQWHGNNKDLLLEITELKAKLAESQAQDQFREQTQSCLVERLQTEMVQMRADSELQVEELRQEMEEARRAAADTAEAARSVLQDCQDMKCFRCADYAAKCRDLSVEIVQSRTELSRCEAQLSDLQISRPSTKAPLISRGSTEYIALRCAAAGGVDESQDQSYTSLDQTPLFNDILVSAALPTAQDRVELTDELAEARSSLGTCIAKGRAKDEMLSVLRTELAEARTQARHLLAQQNVKVCSRAERCAVLGAGEDPNEELPELASWLGNTSGHGDRIQEGSIMQPKDTKSLIGHRFQALAAGAAASRASYTAVDPIFKGYVRAYTRGQLGSIEQSADQLGDRHAERLNDRPAERPSRNSTGVGGKVVQMSVPSSSQHPFR